jgi:hypothetical protein
VTGRRKALVVLVLAISFATLAFFAFPRSNSEFPNEKICSGGQCLNAMIIPSSFDAMPEGFRKQLIEKYFVELLPTRFHIDPQGQVIAQSDGKRDVFQSDSFQKVAFAIERDGADFLDPLWTDLSRARYLESKLGESCDLSKPGRMFGLSERELRRCLRSAYLLQSVPEFNERTQKLFNAVTVKYANGTTGPLSLKREGLTDADRKMVLREVEKIDAKARSLGGFR